MMNQTRYCSTCGMLLGAGAVICGECGARYQDSPYERRATDAPGAWSQAPKPRSRDLGAPSAGTAIEPDSEGIELISAESLQPKAPGATALRSQEQYDQLMVTQPPTNQPGAGNQPGLPHPAGPAMGSGMSSPAMPGATGSGGSSRPGVSGELEPPLDGCTPATPVKRLLAALIDVVISGAIALPLTIGLTLILFQENLTLVAQILVGVGVALPLAYTLLIVWLQGARGITLGKLALGLRITRHSQGGTIGFGRALGRAFIYGLIPVIMALSIFLDPQRRLRGFHDRAIDSVVVDIKAGRDPLKPRPDGFERAGLEHYLGSPSVAVSAHENLTTTPGAAWAEPSTQHAPGTTGTADGQHLGAGTWGEGSSAVSPFAPPPTAPGAESANGTAGAAEDGTPVVLGSPWSPPPVAPAQAAADQGPAADQEHHMPAQPPAAAPDPVPAAWAPQAPVPNASAPASATPYAPAPPDPASQQPMDGSPVAAELTADAWDDGGIDEQTRLVGSAQQDLGDMEQTRVSAVALPPVRTLRIVADDGSERVVTTAVVIGRNPSAAEGEVLFVLKDETRSVSKTHLRLDGTGEDLLATDLGSTNGSAVLRPDGSRESLVPNTPTVVPPGATLAIGDRILTVEREQ